MKTKRKAKRVTAMPNKRVKDDKSIATRDEALMLSNFAEVIVKIIKPEVKF